MDSNYIYYNSDPYCYIDSSTDINRGHVMCYYTPEGFYTPTQDGVVDLNGPTLSSNYGGKLL